MLNRRVCNERKVAKSVSVQLFVFYVFFVVANVREQRNESMQCDSYGPPSLREGGVHGARSSVALGDAEISLGGLAISDGLRTDYPIGDGAIC